MPAPDELWKGVLLMLLGGLPLSLVLYPALLMVPAFLVRALVVRFRRHRLADPAASRAQDRRWITWTLISLLPWGLLGLWVLFALLTQ
jgi:hypothetical protein